MQSLNLKSGTITKRNRPKTFIVESNDGRILKRIKLKKKSNRKKYDSERTMRYVRDSGCGKLANLQTTQT